MVLSDDDECASASIWISGTKKKRRCDGKRDEKNTIFSFSIVLKRTSRRTAANLYSLHHYNLLSFCRHFFRFFRSLLFGRLGWLLVPTDGMRVWWWWRRSFFFHSHIVRPILFKLFVYFIISSFFLGCHIYLKLWSKHEDALEQHSTKHTKYQKKK